MFIYFIVAAFGLMLILVVILTLKVCAQNNVIGTQARIMEGLRSTPHLGRRCTDGYSSGKDAWNGNPTTDKYWYDNPEGR